MRPPTGGFSETAMIDGSFGFIIQNSLNQEMDVACLLRHSAPITLCAIAAELFMVVSSCNAPCARG